MRLANLAVVLFVSAAAAPQAAAVITLGQSNETFALTGIGGNASGQGQSKMTWGACKFDGTSTTCSLTGPYTGLGAGGTYSFTVKYAGNGAFPLIAVSQTPTSDFFFAQAVANYDFFITLTQNNGPVVNFYSFANFNFVFPSPVCTGVTTANCRVSQVGLTVNATMSGPITGSFDPAPTILSSGVVSAANYGGFSSIAPATWIEIYGYNLATTRGQTWAGADFNGDNAPSALGGTTVTVAGKPAYVDFVSPGQVNVQVPSGIPTGVQPLVVTTAGGSSSPYGVRVNTVQPGLLAPPSFVINGNQNVVALFSNTLTYVLPNKVTGVSTDRAKAGDTITMYGIGFGTVTPDTPAGQIVRQNNTLQAQLQVTFAGVPPPYCTRASHRVTWVCISSMS